MELVISRPILVDVSVSAQSQYAVMRDSVTANRCWLLLLLLLLLRGK